MCKSRREAVWISCHRHKAAAITFVKGGLLAAQMLMGHYHATTTDRYVKSAGLYGDQDVILNALGESGIGKAASDLLERKCPTGRNPMRHFVTRTL